jgi:dTDP-4-amino-4,6-dideoxygalactose transaminase
MKVLRHSLSSQAIVNITDVIKSLELGFGPNVSLFEQTFKDFSKKEHNVAVNSASAAAFMIFAYLRESFGECDVYTPSLGFTSPVWAAKHFGHEVIFVDVNDDLLFDCDDYLKKSELPKWRYSTGRRKIIMPVLYGGVSTIPNWKLRGDEIVVIDAAHCPTPTLYGDFVFFSFHPTKPICSSDGGMISTDHDSAAEYFRNYRNFGRVNNLNGYDIVQEGFKFYMNNLNATIALESLKDYYKNLEIRRNNFILIKNNFNGRFTEHDVNSSYYFASLVTEEANKINTKYELTVHYPLLHLAMYYNKQKLVNTEKLHSKIVNLPLYDLDTYNSRSWR